MIEGLVLVTPNLGAVIDDVTAQLHCKCDSDDDLALVKLYNQAATQDVQNHLRRALLVSTWDHFLDDFPRAHSPYGYSYLRRGEIVPPLLPFNSIEFIRCYDASNELLELDPSFYYVDAAVKPARIVPSAEDSWPTVHPRRPSAVQVRFSAGYASPALVPAAIKASILLRLGTLYNSREDMVEGASISPLSEVVTSLLSPYINRWNT